MSRETGELHVCEKLYINEKPPLGIMPRRLHDERRRIELRKAIIRYLDTYKEIPIEWVEEFNEITLRLNK